MTSMKPSSGSSAVSRSTYGAVQASLSDLWMIRLPNRLASAWEEAPDGTVLGTLTFTKGSDNHGPPPAKKLKTNSNQPTNSKMTISISPNISEAQSDLPVHYTLEAVSKKTPGTLHPFTRHADGSVSIHGVVSRTASAQVAREANGADGGDNINRYRTLLRKRLIDTTVNSKRFVQPGSVEVTSTGPLKAATAAASLGTGFGGSVALFGKQMLDAQERNKGYLNDTKVSSGPIAGIDGVRSALFQYFSKRQFWTVKELHMASGGRLPERETREVLRDIAEYHKIGEHKNTWELKAEFSSAAVATNLTNSRGEKVISSKEE